MIWNSIFFHDNHLRRKKLKELELDLTNLFVNYHIAWNEFCAQLGPSCELPPLTKSLTTDTLFECLEEIQDAATILCDIINNISCRLNITEKLNDPTLTLQRLDSTMTTQFLLFQDIVVDSLTAVVSFFIMRATILKVVALNLEHAADQAAMDAFAAQTVYQRTLRVFTDASGNFSFTNTSICIAGMAILVLTVDLFISYFAEANSYQYLLARYNTLKDVSDRLTHIIKHETSKLTSLTQSLKDGALFLDKEHMLLVDTATSTAKLIKLDVLEYL
ncbi:MAG: hypothetical protein ACRCSG_03875 [Cellulosilyticaceae bacterium]